MSFQPSLLSYPPRPGVSHTAGSGEYGWPWGQKDQRAKRKLSRARQQRKRGRTKRAERLERRAGLLGAQSRDEVSTLHPGSTYQKLWASKFPWAERRRMSSSGLIGAARGYRPGRPQIRAEWRATILGGLAALQAAGIESFVDLDVQSLPQKMTQGGDQDKKLVRAVARGTGQGFKGSLRRAAAAIRKVVIEHGLEEAAWPARALPMLGAGAQRAGITSASAGAASAALGTAATATLAASPGPQIIVTAPVSAVLWAATAATTAISSGASVKKTIAASKAQEYQQAFDAAIEAWNFEKGKEIIQREATQARAQAALQEEVTRKVGEIRGKNIAGTVQVLAWAGGISFALIATSTVVGHLRNRS